MYYTHLDSPVGTLLLTGDGSVLTGLYFIDQKHTPAILPEWKQDEAPFTQTIQQLKEYFGGERQIFDVPVGHKGTELQQQVWHALVQIPYGKTTTYKAIAESIGRPKAHRAVGTMIGQNPLCIVVPCHRVIASSGGLGGYAGGIENKVVLLGLETTAISE
jgi:methylated-DNA-[protein]-cysteine S-methyltransferase